MSERKGYVQEDGTLDLRGIDHIKDGKYQGFATIKEVIIGSSVQTIGQHAFHQCYYLEELIFEEPCQLTKIEYACFLRCYKLRKIDLPPSIEEIEMNAFLTCPLERVILRGPCFIGHLCFCINDLTYIHIADSIQKLDKDAFYGNEDIPFSESPCKIYIRPEFQDRIKHMFQRHGRCVEFIENDLEEGHMLK